MKDQLRNSAVAFCALTLFLLVASASFADVVQMQNGDRYVGKIVAMTNDVVFVQSEVLGLVKVPRDKVSAITLGNAASPPPAVSTPATPATGAAAQPTNTVVRVSSSPATNATTDFQTLFKQQPNSAKLMEQVKSQYLADASPEAQAKFNEMMGGLISGKITVADIKREAKSAADQIRELKKELGDQAGDLDGYLQILDHFLSEPGPAPAPPRPAATPSKKPAPGQDDN
jgi:hypothetical protein